MQPRAEILAEYQQELTEERDQILAYWYHNTIDHIDGGFLGKIDHGNHVVHHANKGVILNARILWTFSAAFNQLPDPRWLFMAKRAFEYIKAYFIDHKHKGVIWEVDYKGNPISQRKQTYAQAFVIYALCEYYKIERKKEALELANTIFNLLQKHCYDKELGGYIEAFGRDWSPIKDVRLSSKDHNEKKTMNTHLHVLEAFTNLYRVHPSSEVYHAQKELIETFIKRFMNENAQLNLFFDENWHLKSDEISFGHDIETSWLLYEAAEVLGDKELIHATEKIAIAMVNKVIELGVDSDGSILNHFSPKQNKLDSDRHWWPQAEAMVGFVSAYELTNDSQYLEHSIKTWDYVKQNILDKNNGEWFWRVDIKGKPYANEDKVGFWKCPYHNTRACLEIIDRINKMKANK